MLQSVLLAHVLQVDVVAQAALVVLVQEPLADGQEQLQEDVPERELADVLVAVLVHVQDDVLEADMLQAVGTIGITEIGTQALDGASEITHGGVHGGGAVSA